MTVPQLQITVVVPGEEALLLELQDRLDYESEMLYVEPGERPMDGARILRRLRGEDGPGCFTMLARLDGKPCGYATVLTEPWSRISRTGCLAIAISEIAQGRGYGRELLEAVIDQCRERRLHRLELTVRTDNLRAQKLYLACGFQIEGTRREAVLTNGVWHDEIFMAILL